MCLKNRVKHTPQIHSLIWNLGEVPVRIFPLEITGKVSCRERLSVANLQIPQSWWILIPTSVGLRVIGISFEPWASKMWFSSLVMSYLKRTRRCSPHKVSNFHQQNSTKQGKIHHNFWRKRNWDGFLEAVYRFLRRFIDRILFRLRSAEW